jgi:hypothetical protein
MYDARIGRRWNIDPLENSFASPYSVFNNNPIVFSDPDGLAPTLTGFVGAMRKIWSAICHPFNKGRRDFQFHFGSWKKGSTGGHWSVGEIFMSVVGALRKGSLYHLMLIPQGINTYSTTSVSGTVAPGGFKDEKFMAWINVGPFTPDIMSIFGSVWNDDANFNIDKEEWENDGKIDGYVSVEGAGADEGWHGMHMNTGLRGWMRPLMKPKEYGGIIVGSEYFPFLNIVDDILGGVFGWIRQFEFINKSVVAPKYRHVTALKVHNAKHTKHNIGYYFDIIFRGWKKVQNWDNLKTGTRSERSKLWRKLHRR